MIVKRIDLGTTPGRNKWDALKNEVRSLTMTEAVVHVPEGEEAPIRVVKSRIENWLHAGEFKGQYSATIMKYAGREAIVIQLRNVLSHRPMIGAK